MLGRAAARPGHPACPAGYFFCRYTRVRRYAPGLPPRQMGGHVTAQLRNWSGTYQFTARQVITARTVDEVRRAVAAGGRVRAVGTRHSFNDLADNGATLVSVAGIAPDPVIDTAARTVTAGAGMSYGALAAWLQDRGWALHNLGRSEERRGGKERRAGGGPSQQREKTGARRRAAHWAPGSWR